MLERHIRDRGEQLAGPPPFSGSLYTGNADEREAALVASYAAKGMFREAAVVLRGRKWIGLKVKPQNEGVLVERVARNMPADQAGIRPGDLLIRWKGMPLGGLGSVFGPTELQKFQAVVESVAVGERVPVELNRGGQTHKVDLFMGFIPEFAAPRPASGLAMKFERLEIRPGHISAGAPFEVDMDYTIGDPASRTDTVTAEIGYRILEGEKVLFAQPAVRVEVPKGGVRHRTERLTASPRKGTYKFLVSLRCGQSVVEQSVDFVIE